MAVYKCGGISVSAVAASGDRSVDLRSSHSVSEGKVTSPQVYTVFSGAYGWHCSAVNFVDAEYLHYH